MGLWLLHSQQIWLLCLLFRVFIFALNSSLLMGVNKWGTFYSVYNQRQVLLDTSDYHVLTWTSQGKCEVFLFWWPSHVSRTFFHFESIERSHLSEEYALHSIFGMVLFQNTISESPPALKLHVCGWQAQQGKSTATRKIFWCARERVAAFLGTLVMLRCTCHSN